MKTKGFFEQLKQSSTAIWIAAAAVVVVWGLVALMIVAGIFLYLERPTVAQQPPVNVAVPAVSVQPTTARVGSSLIVSGEGWTPGSLVSIYLLPPGQTQTPNFAAAQVTADAQGKFTTSVAIPSAGDWQSLGTATVITRLASGGASAQTTFNLTAAPQAATSTPTPTETPTLVPTPTPTPASTEASVAAAPTVTSKVNLNIRSGPGINYPIIGVLLAGQSAKVSGVSADGGWWQVLFPAGPDGVGWVSAPYVTSQNTDNVPVVAAPPVPQPTPTPTPVAQPPTAVISGPGQAGQSQIIVFDGNGSTASPGHNIVDFAWNFGDGTTANGSSVSHSYGNSGTFVVSLTVTDDLGQTGTATLTIQITAQGPTAQFDAPKEGVMGQSVSFDAGDSHAAFGHYIVDYDWNFDDGHSSSGSSPDHTFNKTGTFDVRLRVTDDQGLTSDVRHHITIEGLPTASISGPSQGTVGQSLTFSGSSNDDDITSFQWNFGDGGTASGQTVSHAFALPGNFVVTLTIFDDEGANATAAQVVAINPLLQPPTAFIIGPNSGTENQAVSFDGSQSVPGSGSIISYAWDFGDGSTGNGAQVSHTYTKAGQYTVILTVISSDNLTSQAQHIIQIAGLVGPHAVISGPNSGTENQAVSFDGSKSDPGSGSITSYAWDFGDGSNGSGAQVSHTYAKAGKYAVILTVTNSDNLTSSVKHTITIGTVTTPPKAVISGPTSGAENQAVSFDGSKSDPGSGSITSYAWDFGDGSNGSGAQVSHTYTKAGKYAVILTVTNSDNLTDSVKHGITIGTVTTPPKAVVNGPTSGAENQAVSFDGSKSDPGSGSITSYAWDFGDGSTGSGAQVSHTYTKAGKYAVILTVTNSDNLTSSVKHTITIGTVTTPPKAVVNGPNSGTENQAVSFDGSKSDPGSGSITSYAWNFGDGSNGSGAQVSHTYAKAGKYAVILTVTNSDNLTSSVKHTITIGTVTTPPKAVISGPSSGTENQAVSFDGSKSDPGSGSITSYAWDFGDGSNGSGAQVSHTYTKAGKYAVILTVTNSDKLTSSVKHTITIGAAASPPKAAISGPSSGTENQAVSFDGSKSAPGSGSITSYAWDFGDGSSGSGAQVSHTYTKAGKYAVILTVTNSDKLTNQAKHGITIAAQQQQQQKQQQQQQSSNPHPPTAVISGSSSGKVGKSISFSAKGSQPGSGSKKITQEVWSFGDGGTASGAHVSHKYSAPGTYTVTLTVTNDKNLTSSATRSVTIS